MSHKLNKQSGFTLVEIMLAMAIFTFMLLVVSMAYINIARLYNASTAARNVQQNNRFAMEQISRVARSSKTVELPTPDSKGGLTSICFNRATKFYVDNGALRQATVTSCSDAPKQEDQTLTSPGVSVARIEADTPGDSTITLRMWMASRVDLLDTADPSKLGCKTGAGSEFCAINKLETTVQLRGN